MKNVNETSSGASGSFETGFGGPMIKRSATPYTLEETKPKKKKKKKMKNITLSEIEKIVMKTLIFEEVYSEKPIEPKGKEISTKNLKNEFGSSKSSKKTVEVKKKSGTEHKADISQRTEKVTNSLKNNLKNAEVKDVNKSKKVDDDYETEAYQNGMEDIEYERITPEQKEKIKKQIGDDKVGKKMVKQAKQRVDAKEKNPLNRIARSGSDMEFIKSDDDVKNAKPRKNSVASENAIKRLVFKESFRGDNQMLSKIPSKYKENDKIFEMFDGNNKYKIRWEGSTSNGTGVILEHENYAQNAKNQDFFEKLNNFGKEEKGKTINENQIFKKMLDHSRTFNPED